MSTSASLPDGDAVIAGVLTSAREQRLRLLGRLASVFVRPLSYLPEPYVATAFPDGADYARLKRFAAFVGPINRAFATGLNWNAYAPDSGFMQRLEDRPATRLCVILASDQDAPVVAAATFVAAACLHRRVVESILKVDRMRLQSIFGDDAFKVAIQESALLHGPLVTLDASEKAKDPLADIHDEDASRQRIVAYGHDILCRFVTAIEPSLATVFKTRFLTDDAGGAAARKAMPPETCDHVVRLMRRRMPQWAPIIG